MNRLLHIVALSAFVFVTASESAPMVGGRRLLKERLLAESGFRLRMVTTSQQQQQLDALPHGRVSAVMYQGKRYYVFPAAQRNQVYVGREPQFTAYRAALAAHRREFEAMRRPNDPYADYNIDAVTPSANHFSIRKFVGFGPLRPENE